MIFSSYSAKRSSSFVKTRATTKSCKCLVPHRVIFYRFVQLNEGAINFHICLLLIIVTCSTTILWLIYSQLEMQNLDALHDHLGTLYPGMRAPSFRCTEGSDGSLILHYYSERPGLEHIVIGIVRVRLKRFKLCSGERRFNLLAFINPVSIYVQAL